MRVPLLLCIICTLISHATAQEAVILLHGLCRSSSSMDKLAKTLTESGYVVENVAYPSRQDQIKILAKQAIAPTLNKKKIQSCSKVHFVTHSMGGILVRSYFSNHQYDKLGRVVMLGPPNNGSEVIDKIGAWKLTKFINGPAGCELGTDDKSVPNKLGKVNFELGVISGDRSINWINSLMIAGADDGKVSVERTKVEVMKDHVIVHATHPFMMKNKEVIRHTLNFLKMGSFVHPNT